MRNNKYAFLDRDGTLIYEPQDTYQIDSLEKLRLLPGAIKGLKFLQRRGYSLVMVTNQDGLGTPSFPKEDFEKPQQRLLEILHDDGITFTDIFICPHFPTDNCDCRKPQTTLLHNLLANTTLDEVSFVCGDREGDMLLAKNLGVRSIAMKTNGNFYTAIKAYFEAIDE